jgi:hypothetical protein
MALNPTPYSPSVSSLATLSPSVLSQIIQQLSYLTFGVIKNYAITFGVFTVADLLSNIRH